MRSSTRRGKCFIISKYASVTETDAGLSRIPTHSDAHSPTKDSGHILIYRGKLQKKEESRQTCIKVVTLPHRTDILMQGDLPVIRVGATLPCWVVILAPM